MATETDKPVTITLQCPKCGSKQLDLSDSPKDDDLVACKQCAHPFGTWGEIKAQAVAFARKAQDAKSNPFRPQSGWTLGGSKRWH